MPDVHISRARLIVVGGFAGAGKSTLARRLGNALFVPVFEIDQMARNIRDSKDFHGTQTESHGIAFDFFYAFARQHLHNRGSLIFDQNMGSPTKWQLVTKLSEEVTNIEVKILILDCPYEVCVERFNKREVHPNLNEINIHEHKPKWDYLNDNDFASALRLDATKSMDEVFREALSLLSQ